jgi:hypothetical protein
MQLPVTKGRGTSEAAESFRPTRYGRTRDAFGVIRRAERALEIYVLETIAGSE